MNNRFAYFYELLDQLPHACKEEIVFSFSDGKTTSLREFYATDPKGFKRMIYRMQTLVEKKNDPATKRLRSGILVRLQKYGVDTTDWQCVNRFLEQKKIAGKRLYEMTNDEMKELIPKLESMLKKQAEKLDKMKETALCN